MRLSKQVGLDPTVQPHSVRDVMELKNPGVSENPSLPRVGQFSIAPIKSFGLVHPTKIKLNISGVAEDRRFFLIDDDDRLIDALVFGPLMQIGTWTNSNATFLRLTFPGGFLVEGDVHTTNPIVITMYRRIVHGHIVDGPWATALEPFVGRHLRLVKVDRPGELSREYTVTLVSDGSLAELGYNMGTDPVDGRRFRMLIELHGAYAHEEDSWIGRRISLGKYVILRIKGSLPRCAKITMNPDSGVRDLDILRAIRKYRGLRGGRYLDFGVYGEVEVAGRVQLGDDVRLLNE